MTTPHTSEPWAYSPGSGIYCADPGDLPSMVVRKEAISEQDAARIVACVNALAGVEDPAAALAAARTAMTDAVWNMPRTMHSVTVLAELRAALALLGPAR